MVATLHFSGPVFEWRGPAPIHFARIPEDGADLLGERVPVVSYGWGMVPVSVRIGDTEWRTSLWPKEGGYVLPVRDKVRRAERIALDGVVDVRMTVIGS
ncbi:DUF1905 domain-containing protein [Labedella populi]|uniref:DUF1905 domain-containing protein n=1 Tax=Labedella populi TaxID=2498850 RepID=A0A444Q5Z3_9MICO|nr:DUF1905 domain-containing protein [Labedella populi]RWZ59281.1 DUF1905 domain-containing protein [Labedella populi]